MLALCFSSAGFTSQPKSLSTDSWTLWKKNEAIKISYQKLDDTPLIEIKVNATIKSTLSGFLLFIQDTDNIPNWLDNAKSSKVIKYYSVQENLFITHFNSFWPISKRYMLINSRHWQNEDLSVEIMVKDINEEEYLHHNRIKIEVKKAHWHIKPIENGNIHITYTIVADPKGVIPFWITKRVSLNSMWATMNNMLQQLPISHWQKGSLPYITEK